MPGSLVSEVADCEAPELGNSFTAGKLALAGIWWVAQVVSLPRPEYLEGWVMRAMPFGAVLYLARAPEKG